MAISGTTVASVFTSANATSYATGSYTPTANRLMVCSICSELSGVPDITEVTGNGLTWSLIAEYQADTTGTQNLIAVYAAFSGGSPSAGAVTVSYGAVTQSGGSVIVDEYDGCDLSGTVAACFVQTKTGTVNGSGTSETITLNSAITGSNASGGVFQHQADETSSNGSGYSILGNGSHSGPSSSLITEYKAAGSTTVDASWTTSAGKGGIAFELKALAGTTYNQSVSGGITPSGALSKTDNKTVAGTLTSAGAISKSTAKTLAGTQTTSGALSKLTSKLFAGTLTTAGALESIRLFVKAIEGTLTSAGTLVRDTLKSLSGTLTGTGTINKSISKSPAGTLASSGAISKETQKTLVGTLTSSGLISKSISKLFSGTLTSAGALGKEIQKALAGTLTSSGTISRSISKLVSGILTTSGTISKSISKVLSGILTSIGALVTEFTGGSTPVVGNGDRVTSAKREIVQSIQRVRYASGARPGALTADTRQVAKATKREIIRA